MSTPINANPTQTQQILGGQQEDATSDGTKNSVSTTGIVADAKAKLNKFTLTGQTNPNQNKKVYAKEIQPIVEQENAIKACERTTQQPGISPEAKAVYQHVGDTLEMVKQKCDGNYSPQNIGAGFTSALKGRTDLSALGGTGTVGGFDENDDGTGWRPVDPKYSTHGLAAPNAWTKNPITGKWDVPVDVGQKQCLAALENANIKAQPLDASGKAPKVEDVLKNPPYPQNLTGCDFSKLSDDDVRKGSYTFVDPQTSKTTTTYTWEPGADPRKFRSQIGRESNTFSGNVHIRKLEPGTVLVRVFGQGQSAKASCWCLLTDKNSSVICAQDLYKKLGVKVEWNGDGNLAILVIPEGVDIYVAEGKIASQAEKYTAEVKKNGKNAEQRSTFLYEGGGTQLNILTPDGGTFAGIDPKILDMCIICYRDDNIIPSKQFTQTT